MELLAVSASVVRQRTDCAIVGVYEKGTLSAAAKELDKKLAGQLTRLVKQGDVRGKLGESLLLPELHNAPPKLSTPFVPPWGTVVPFPASAWFP